jgi:hypothetical protein
MKITKEQVNKGYKWIQGDRINTKICFMEMLSVMGIEVDDGLPELPPRPWEWSTDSSGQVEIVDAGGTAIFIVEQCDNDALLRFVCGTPDLAVAALELVEHISKKDTSYTDGSIQKLASSLWDALKACGVERDND